MQDNQGLKTHQVKTDAKATDVQNSVKYIFELHNILNHLENTEEQVGVESDRSCI